MTDIIFATMIDTDGSARQAQLWAASIRAFAGRFARAPIWLLIPGPRERVAASIRAALEYLEVRLIDYNIGEPLLDFPFAGKTVAAGVAEALAHKQASFLVWMDRDSLVLQEPTPLNLTPGKIVGCRPVDHTLIGSPLSAPPDPFWSLIYDHFGLDSQQLEPMVTSVDEQAIRPYFNAGMLVVRPQHQLLRHWSNSFQQLYDQLAFATLYEQDFRYRLFVHQAILTGSVLSKTEPEERIQLPYLVNYPLHMHTAYPANKRASSLNEVVTCRYDTMGEQPDWSQVISITEPLLSWLENQRKALAMA